MPVLFLDMFPGGDSITLMGRDKFFKGRRQAVSVHHECSNGIFVGRGGRSLGQPGPQGPGRNPKTEGDTGVGLRQ